MKSISRILPALIATSTFIACYGATYSGIYVLDRVYNVSSGLPDFEAEVYKAIKPFGFLMVKAVPQADFILFATEQRRMLPEFAMLAGASREVSIALAPRRFSITIRDMGHRDETEFVRALKRSIEDRLEQQYGIRGLKFERQWDLFA